MKRDTKFKKGHKPSPEMRKAISEGQIGNQNAVKLSTPELKAEAYRQYCVHIASGFSKEAWCFKHPDLNITFKTMEKYIRENPSDFPIIQKEQAETESLLNWEKQGIMMMNGQVEKCQPAIYQMFMRNKFGWDKENNVSLSFEPEVRQMFKKWKDIDENN